MSSDLTKFQGVTPAIVSPLTENLDFDEQAMGRMIEQAIFLREKKKTRVRIALLMPFWVFVFYAHTMSEEEKKRNGGFTIFCGRLYGKLEDWYESDRELIDRGMSSSQLWAFSEGTKMFRLACQFIDHVQETRNAFFAAGRLSEKHVLSNMFRRCKEQRDALLVHYIMTVNPMVREIPGLEERIINDTSSLVVEHLLRLYSYAKEVYGTEESMEYRRRISEKKKNGNAPGGGGGGCS